MLSIRSRGDPLIQFDPELNRTIRRMENKQNLAHLGYGIFRQLPPMVDTHNQVVAENQVDDAAYRPTPSGVLYFQFQHH